MPIEPSQEEPLAKRREGDVGNRRWRSRLLWFAGLWLAGVSTVIVLSYGIRAMIMP